MRSKFVYFSLAFCVPLTLFADEEIETSTPANNETIEQEVEAGPWFTGPLLTASGHTIPEGHFNIEPYLFYDNIMGVYDNHWNLHRVDHIPSNLNFQALIQIGLLNNLDLSITPQCFYNFSSDGSSHWGFGDLSMKLGIQLRDDDPKRWFPSIKLTLGETFPTGKYQFLDENGNGTDATGGGSFGPSFGFVSARQIHFKDVHYLSLRGQFQGTVFSGVDVHGKNAFGGDPTTNGRVLPGAVFIFLGGAEYSVTRNFALACDFANVWSLKTNFKGTTTVPVGSDYSSYQLSFAPALEWNFNANIGIIGGVWFTAIGVNSASFVNGVIALNWFI